MTIIEMDQLDEIFRAFSSHELNAINRVSAAIDRALGSLDRAFTAKRETIPARLGLNTSRLAVITPARLQDELPVLEQLHTFWRSEWRNTPAGRTARIFGRAADDLAKAVSIIQAWLTEIEPLVLEQHRLGMPAERLLPQAERDRAVLLAQPAPRMSASDRQRLLNDLRTAVHRQGGVVNPAVFHGIVDLAERDDPQAMQQLLRIRETVEADKLNIRR